MPSQQISADLKHYIESARVALALADTIGDNTLLLVNQSFCTLTGYGMDEVVGRNCRFLQVATDRRDPDNSEARAEIHYFLEEESASTVRTPIVNFTKSGKPFVNLLFMSKLRGTDGQVRFIFASQFDVSRSHLSLLEGYDQELSRTLSELSPVLQESGLIIDGSLASIANSATMIAQAKLTLSDLEATGS